mmetsp:Transcript_23580/g.60533  ORF Transcript_23580/g.60533 Transcript_23580/m.60533 type:complete len:107 (+) Transcript_23580:1616-1936(+)
MAQGLLGNRLQLGKQRSTDLFSPELLQLALVLGLDHRLVVVVPLDDKGPELHVGLQRRVAEVAADQTLGVEDGVDGVHRHLVEGLSAHQTALGGKGYVRGRRPAAG